MDGAILLVAYTGTLNAVVSLLIAIRLYVSYRKTHSPAIGYFLLFYFYFGIFYFYFATTQIFLPGDTGVTVGIFHVVSYFFLFLSISYLLSFPFILNNRESLAFRLVLVILLFNVIFLALRIINFKLSELQHLGNYLYWKPIFPEWMRVLTGILSVGIAAFAASFFFIHGWQRRSNPFIFRRSIWLGSGIALFTVAALLSFIAAPSGSFSFVLVATAFVLAGLLVILRGVYYREAGQGEEERNIEATLR